MEPSTTTSDKDAEIFEHQPPVRSLHDDELLALLAARDIGALATIKSSGFPHLSTVIYSWDPDASVLRFSTKGPRAKARNASRNPHGALFVEGPDQWSFVVAEGNLEVSPVSTEVGDATGRELLTIFPQPDPESEATFLATQVAEERVVIRLHVTRLYGDIIELAS